MSQETIRKLAHDPAPITPELRRMIKVAIQWAKDTDREIDEHAMGLFALHLLAPFGALLEIAELRTDCLNKPMRTGCNCYGCRTRAALADIQKG